MPITRGFNHVATQTTDLDRHAAWYGQVFGAEVTFTMEAAPEHPRMFILDLGGGAALDLGALLLLKSRNIGNVGADGDVLDANFFRHVIEVIEEGADVALLDAEFDRHGIQCGPTLRPFACPTPGTAARWSCD